MKNPIAPDPAWHEKRASFTLAQTKETAPDNFVLYKVAFWVRDGDVATELRRIADQMEQHSGQEKRAV